MRDPRLDARRIGALVHAPLAQALIDLVTERPGIRLCDAAHPLGVTRNAVKYHVRRLQRHGLLDVMREGRSMMLFHRKDKGRFDRLPPSLLRHPIRGPLLRALEAAPEGLPRQEAHRILEHVPRRSRNYTISALVRAGYVRETTAPQGPWLTLAADRACPSGTGALAGSGAGAAAL